MARVAPLAVALLAASSLAPDDKERLQHAAQLLHGPREPEVRQGARECLAVGNADSIQLLIDVLNREQPHFRDIVFEVLPDYKDPYARRVVAKELRANKKDEGVREWCAQLLGLYGDPELAPALVEALSDVHPTVRAAAARSLGKLKFEAGAKKLEKIATDKDPFARADAIEALAAIDARTYDATFAAGLKDADAGVRCALLGALPRLYPDRAESSASATLDDPDWRPRMQAVENLGVIKTKGAVEALATASGDRRPVVAMKATRFLQKLSGKQFTLADQWSLWWKENRDTFEFGGESKSTTPGDDGKRTRASYHGLPVESDHVAFVIDKSNDMTKPFSKGGSKDEAARKELEATLGRLLGTTFFFNGWTYGDDLKTFSKAPVPLDDKSERALLKWIEKETCSGNKNIWQVLETVVSDPDLDTVYLLSSGEPEVGLYVHWNRVCDHLANLNRFHKVVVHTVVYSDSAWYREQLEHIASSTGGSFTSEQ